MNLVKPETVELDTLLHELVSYFEWGIETKDVGLAGNCHTISLGIVQTGILKQMFGVRGRVARGWADVGGQHSWITLGDPYDPTATIIDPTRNDTLGHGRTAWVGTLEDGIHTPHGAGDIFEWGRPPDPIEEPIDWPKGISAQWFVRMVGELDAAGWRVLAHAPVGGWPSKEIWTLAWEQDHYVAPFVPIDVIGMRTDLNPQGLYW